jgi:hypothetical protein
VPALSGPIARVTTRNAMFKSNLFAALFVSHVPSEYNMNDAYKCCFHVFLAFWPLYNASHEMLISQQDKRNIEKRF